MKKLIRFFAVAIATVLFVSSMKFDVEAASYTYSVSFYSGGQGTFQSYSGIQVRKGEGNKKSISVESSSDKVTISGLEYGDVVSCDAPRTVALNENSKYYVKGIRLSGRDNNTVASSAFTVFEDQDYVVAYGIPGELTEYTINYVDTDGNSLADSKTYFGNVGDEPVIAYLYIDGYIPNSYNQTAKLESDKSKNVFTFVYSAITTGNNGAGNGNDGGNTDNGGDGAAIGGNPNGANPAGGNAAGNPGNVVVIPDGQNTPDLNVIVPNVPPINTISDSTNELPLGAGPGDIAGLDVTHDIPEQKLPLSVTDWLFEQGLIYPVLVGVAGIVVLIVLIINYRKLRRAATISTEKIIEKEDEK